MAKSLGTRLTEVRGVGPGFNHLRIGLALSILTWHSFSISYGQAYAETLPRFPVPMLLSGLLPMFFGLSGFLVMGSALRTNELKAFITFRVLRILPALFTEVMLSALVLGPVLTVLPLRAYYRSSMFIEYFGSLIGRVRFSLPGLFVTNPAPEIVNFALWTVGPEILCYVIMALLMLSGSHQNRSRMITITFAYLIVSLAVGWIFPSRGVVEVLPAKILIWGFLVGNLTFLYREFLPFNYSIALISGTAGLMLLYAAQSFNSELLAFAAVSLLIYVVAVVGLTKLPPLPFFDRGDYSYGIYIFGFPIQQAIAYFMPTHREWFVNLLIALPITLLFAVSSWHFIEKPVLSLRKLIVKKEGLPLKVDGRFNIQKTALAIGLVVYGLFVIDASNVFPLRSGTKMVLYGFGMYQYKPTDVRPFTSPN